MALQPNFETASSWTSARGLLSFEPRQPRNTAGLPLQSLRVHVRDHKQRELATGARTLEAHYGRFVLSQSRKGEAEAKRLALDVSYGRSPRPARIAGHDARIYELGPEPEPDDIDGRMPAVVTWHDEGMFFFIASTEMSPDALVAVAMSLYATPDRSV